MSYIDVRSYDSGVIFTLLSLNALRKVALPSDAEINPVTDLFRGRDVRECAGMDSGHMFANISVVIPTFRRPEQLVCIIERILSCNPQPAEILVHIDAGDEISEPRLRAAFPAVRVLKSTVRRGPGGARNRLIEAAKHECIASFDDDSWPMDTGFFSRGEVLLVQFPEIAVFACRVIEADSADSMRPGDDDVSSVEGESLIEASGFGGGACIVRRSAFMQTDGYVPLERAYGMEEADLTLKLLDRGWRLGCVDLNVYHDCERTSRHADTRINAAQITNTALLGVLRYPVSWWPYGALQVINRLRFCIRNRRYRGMLRGLWDIPISAWRNRRSRRSVSADSLRELIRLRRCPRRIQPRPLKAGPAVSE